MNLSKKFAGIFASGMFLITTFTILIRLMSLSASDVFYACKIGLLSAIVFAGLGYLFGKNFEAANNKSQKQIKKLAQIKAAELGIDELLIDDLNKVKEELEK